MGFNNNAGYFSILFCLSRENNEQPINLPSPQSNIVKSIATATASLQHLKFQCCVVFGIAIGLL